MKLFQDEKFALIVVAKMMERLRSNPASNIKLKLLLEHVGKGDVSDETLNSIAEATISALLDNELPF
jgi:hypothetical protein